METNWNLSKRQLIGLALYSCAFPVGLYFENQLHLPHTVLLSLINLPFLVILGPLLMLVEPLHIGRLPTYFLAWVVIFIQVYLAFVYLRRRAEHAGISTSKALIFSLRRLAAFSIITLVIGGLVLVWFFQLP